MSITLSALQQQRRDTAANWTSANPTLLAGEWGYETDTGKWKVGDGSTAWTSLGYVAIPDNDGLIPIDQLLLPAGTAAAPSLTFTGDVDTGIYRSGADALAFSTGGTGRLFIDSSGNIGVGTSSPSEELEVVGDIKFGSGSNTWLSSTNVLKSSNSQGAFLRAFVSTAANPTYAQVGDENTGVYFPAADALGLTTGGTERLRIDSSGNTGIGTSSPSSKLHVYGTENNSIARVQNTDGTNGYGLFVKGGGSASGRYVASFQDAAGNTRLHVLADGTVGIGTTSPTEKLAVDGNIETVSSTGKIGFNVGDEYSGLAHYGLTRPSGSLPINLSGYYGITFGSNGAERVRVTQTGEVGIGTPSPTHRLEVESATPSDSGGIRISNVLYASNRNRPMLTMGTSGWTGADTNWNTYGWQFRIKSDSSGVGRMTIDTANGGVIESFAVYTNGEAAIAKDLTVYGITVGRGGGALDSNTAVGANALSANTTGTNNTAIGKAALDANTTGDSNIAVGAFALSSSTTANQTIAIGTSALYSLTTANQNTAVGYQALYNTTTGSVNTGTGYRALYANTTGLSNVAFGGSALQDNTTGSSNTAVGTNAAGNTTTGSANVAFGRDALLVSTTGIGNTALGYRALVSSVTGSYGVAIGYESQRYANDTTTAFSNTNVSIGYQALRGSTTPANNTGLNNIAIGYSAMVNSTSAFRNVAIGHTALSVNTTGDNNVAIGAFALDASTTASNNTAVGYGALTAATTGAGNTALGVNAGLAITTGGTNTLLGRSAGDSLTTGDNNTVIGFDAAASSATVSNEITLGNSSVTALRCQVTSITSLSDARDKTNIQPLGAGLQFVNALNPVSFDWNMRDGGKVGVADTGFIAQELQEAQDVTGTVIPGLVYDNNPEKLEASYGKLLPTLVKAIQELSAENAELKARLEAAGI